MRILLVDDHVLFREGLASLLGNQDGLSVVGEADCARDALEQALELNPDLVLLDVSLPDGSGLDAMKTILAHRPETAVVVLTSYESDELLFAFVRNGAVGYLLKNRPASSLIQSLHGIRRGEAALSRTMTLKVLEEFQRVGSGAESINDDMNSLTERELQVLKLLGTGATNREISARLVIAENTAKTHVHNILNKMKFQNRREAGQFARDHQLVLPPSDPVEAGSEYSS